MYLNLSLIMSMLLFSAIPASSQEGLEMFAGQWNGGGEYVRLNGDRVNVRCDIETQASSTALSMNGRCTALVIISRKLSANIKSRGSRVFGHYSGPEGSGAVQGELAGTALGLSVQWEKPVRGDTAAEMKIEIVGADRLRLRTFDLDPATNTKVAVTDLDLRRQ
jgi:hypothetical protein